MIALLLGAALAAEVDGLFLADALRPPTDADGLLAVDGATLPETWEARLDATLAHHALLAYGPEDPLVLVEDVLTLHASAGLRLGPARLTGRVPLGALLRAEGLDQPAVAAGDPALGLTLSPWSGRRLAVAAAAELGIPLGGEALWLGSGGPSYSAIAILDGRAGAWRLALNAGIRGQPAVDLLLYDDADQPSLSRQILARAALERRLGQDSHLSLELAGALDTHGYDQSTPLEALVGYRRQRAQGQILRVGAGLGLLPGVGAPGLRVMVGVGQQDTTP